MMNAVDQERAETMHPNNRKEEEQAEASVLMSTPAW